VIVRFRLVVDGEVHSIEVTGSNRAMVVRVDGAAYPVQGRARGADIEVRVRGVPHRIRFDGPRLFLDGTEYSVAVDSVDEPSEVADPSSPSMALRRIEVRSPMPGRLVRVDMSEGKAVRRGEALAVLEAMKMQNEIPSPADAIVIEVLATEGETVTADRVIAVLEMRPGRDR
jgi:biotin carboxyl carrier protein